MAYLTLGCKDVYIPLSYHLHKNKKKMRTKKEIFARYPEVRPSNCSDINDVKAALEIVNEWRRAERNDKMYTLYVQLELSLYGRWAKLDKK